MFLLRQPLAGMNPTEVAIDEAVANSEDTAWELLAVLRGTSTRLARQRHERTSKPFGDSGDFALTLSKAKAEHRDAFNEAGAVRFSAPPGSEDWRTAIAGSTDAEKEQLPSQRKVKHAANRSTSRPPSRRRSADGISVERDAAEQGT